jgi:hypothetical protein
MRFGWGLYNGLYPSANPVSPLRPQDLENPVQYVEEIALPSAFLGFYPDATGFEAQIAAFKQLVNTYLDYSPIWMASEDAVGLEPTDTLGGDIETAMAYLNQTMKDEGIDDWLAEVNRQLDEFIAN